MEQGFGRPIPAGWYQIGWSEDFAVGEVKPLRYFGQDLVGFRTTAGKLTVLDAHCPHLGAHLGYGGFVEDENIVCPFHGWVWSSEGENVSIPDGSPANRAQKIPGWPVAEQSGLVLIWYHPNRNAPEWEVPVLVPDTSLYHNPEGGRKLWTINAHPQAISENAIDSLHFEWVHRAGESPTILGMEENGANLHVSQEIVYGAGKDGTWLTPEGPKKGSLEVNLWGLGLAFTRFAAADETLNLVAPTPIEDGVSEYRMSNWVPVDASANDEFVSRRHAEQFKQAERDIVIWNHQKYIAKPPYSRTEARAYRRFRDWASQFYSETSEQEVEVAL